MAEEQILGFKPAAGLEQVGNEYCKRVQDWKHHSKRCDDSALSCESRPDRIFGRDRNLDELKVEFGELKNRIRTFIRQR